MSGQPGPVRRSLAAVWRTVQWIHTGEAEMREVYGANPNDLTASETIASAALISLGLFAAAGS